MSEIKFTQDHEWLRLEGEVAVVGITDYAQAQLGDIVHVELPEIGSSLERGAEAAVIESVKAAGEIKSPAGGTVVEVNALLIDDPAKVNEDPLGAGWFYKLRLADASELAGLLDQAAYDALVADLS